MVNSSASRPSISRRLNRNSGWFGWNPNDKMGLGVMALLLLFIVAMLLVLADGALKRTVTIQAGNGLENYMTHREAMRLAKKCGLATYEGTVYIPRIESTDPDVAAKLSRSDLRSVRITTILHPGDQLTHQWWHWGCPTKD